MNEKKLTKLEKYWILYDVGNSAFTLLVATILPIYFNALASGEDCPKWIILLIGVCGISCNIDRSGDRADIWNDCGHKGI